MYIAFVSNKPDYDGYIGSRKRYPFGVSEEGFSYIFDVSPKRHRLIEVYRDILPLKDFSIVTQSDLLAYGNPNVKPTRVVFLAKPKSLYDLALTAYRAVLGGVYSVYGQRVMEFETAEVSRWRISIFSSVPSDVNKYFSSLSPSDVRVIRYGGKVVSAGGKGGKG